MLEMLYFLQIPQVPMNINFIFLILPTFKGDTTNKDREIKKCLTEAYKKTDDDFLHEASKA